MKRTFQNLTIKNSFMFAAVMCEDDNCKEFLEMALGIEIEKVEVDKEKTMAYHPQYKGIRLDIYAKDEHNTRYNVEMQVRSQASCGKRARYYHSQIDMDMLAAGLEYSELPPAFVIFVCDFDPYGEKKYLYTFENLCLQDYSLGMKDASRTLFLSTAGENSDEVPESMVKFLKFVHADLENSMQDFDDDYVRKLQKCIQNIKLSREMEAKYMVFEELMKEEFRAGKAEGKTEGKAESILELLGELGNIPVEIENRVCAEKDLEILKKWNKLAAKADSIEQFIQNM